jgi:hypothetical protein
LPPPERLAACLAVLERALIRAHLLGYEGEAVGLGPDAARELAALADAVHNIPRLVQTWPSCDEPPLRSMLEEFDRAFPGSALLKLNDGVVVESG